MQVQQDLIPHLTSKPIKVLDFQFREINEEEFSQLLHLPHIERVRLDDKNIKYLKRICEAYPKLKVLHLRECESLKEIEALRNLTFLQKLDLSWCSDLKDIAPVESLSALQEINLSGCDSIISLDPLKKLSQLKCLRLMWCIFTVNELRKLREERPDLQVESQPVNHIFHSWHNRLGLIARGTCFESNWK